MNIIRFFSGFKMRTKFAVADVSSIEIYCIFHKSVVFVAIRCIFIRFSERFCVAIVGCQACSLLPSLRAYFSVQNCTRCIALIKMHAVLNVKDGAILKCFVFQ